MPFNTCLLACCALCICQSNCANKSFLLLSTKVFARPLTCLLACFVLGLFRLFITVFLECVHTHIQYDVWPLIFYTNCNALTIVRCLRDRDFSFIIFSIVTIVSFSHSTLLFSLSRHKIQSKQMPCEIKLREKKIQEREMN